MNARRLLLVLALLAAVLLPLSATSNANAASRLSLSADVERLDVRPCLLETVRIGVTNNGNRDRFVDVYINAESPLRSSKPLFTTYVPAGGTAYGDVRISALVDGAAGKYNVRIEAAGADDLVVPATVVNPPEARCVPREHQTATATSFQDIPDYTPANAIDGDLGTLWHTRWRPATDPLPQSITVELGGSYDVAELVYEPRKDASGNGVVTAYTVYGSSDGQNFSELTAGTWANDRTRKFVNVGATGVRHIQLEVTAGHGGYASAAELVFFGHPH